MRFRLGPEKMNLQGRAILSEEISNWDFAVPVCVCVRERERTYGTHLQGTLKTEVAILPNH